MLKALHGAVRVGAAGVPVPGWLLALACWLTVVALLGGVPLANAQPAAQSAAQVMGPHDLFAELQFVDVENRNLRLKSGSQAIASGSSAAEFDVDIGADLEGRPRPATARTDRGAYAFKAP